MDERLRQATAPREAGAAFVAVREGGLALIPRADAWLHAAVAADARWLGEALVVELPYFPALADAIIEAGFMFEREPYPN